MFHSGCSPITLAHSRTASNQKPTRPWLPPFPFVNRHPFGSARSGPGREAAERTLDGEDRSGIIWREGKGDDL